jgi:hypothetical protein
VFYETFCTLSKENLKLKKSTESFVELTKLRYVYIVRRQWSLKHSKEAKMIEFSQKEVFFEDYAEKCLPLSEARILEILQEDDSDLSEEEVTEMASELFRLQSMNKVSEESKKIADSIHEKAASFEYADFENEDCGLWYEFHLAWPVGSYLGYWDRQSGELCLEEVSPYYGHCAATFMLCP